MPIKSTSSKVAYLILKIDSRYSIKTIQTCDPTSTHDDEDCETFYDDVNTTVQQPPSHYNIEKEDSNARLGCKEDSESSIRNQG